VDLVSEASYSDSDRGHGNNEPKHDGSPPEFGIRDNRDTEGDYADRSNMLLVVPSSNKPGDYLSFQRQFKHFLNGTFMLPDGVTPIAERKDLP
jgi:hypothetical protein